MYRHPIFQNQSTSVISHSASREHRARAAVSVLKIQACPTRSSERFSELCVMHSIRQGSHMWWIVFLFYCIIDVIIIYVHMIIISNQSFSVCGVSAGELAEGGLFIFFTVHLQLQPTRVAQARARGCDMYWGPVWIPTFGEKWRKCGNIHEKG